MRPYWCTATVRQEQSSSLGSDLPVAWQRGGSRASAAARPALARLSFASKQENIMQKTNQPEPSESVSDLQVQPLTTEEIGQVSGGIGSARTLTPVVRRDDNISRGSASNSGKGFSFTK
jgi:hypothetical protein